jgi:cyclin-A
MADKENAVAVGPRVTRAAAKRAASEAATATGKRKRVALGELPTLANAPTASPAKKSKPAKPAARLAKKEGPLKPAAVPVIADPVPPTPPRAEPDSSASSPPRAVPEAESSASSPPTPRAAAADAHLCQAYASDIYTYLRALEVLPLLASPPVPCLGRVGFFRSDIVPPRGVVLQVQPQKRPRADYIEAVQKDISANMRAILVDWLVEVAEEYKLVADTLYLAIYYIDRFLSVNAVARDKLQLLGVAAMLVAA